jgi:hypothetical protein
MRLEYATEETFPEEARKDLDEALEGGVDYFIIVLLKYQEASGGILRPGNVSLRVFRVQNCALVYEMKHTDTKVKPIKEEFDSLKNVARGLVSQLKLRKQL